MTVPDADPPTVLILTVLDEFPPLFCPIPIVDPDELPLVPINTAPLLLPNRELPEADATVVTDVKSRLAPEPVGVSAALAKVFAALAALSAEFAKV